MCKTQRNTWYTYSACLRNDAVVAGLDPLGIDGFFGGRFQEINRCSDPELLLREGETFLPAAHVLYSLDPFNAMAATRDCGFVISAITRSGGKDFGNFEEVLLALSERTEEVPADTVFSYGPRNPEGPRMRTFTGTVEERCFIRSFTDGMRHLLSTVASLDAAQDIPFTDPQFGFLMRWAESQFAVMVSSIIEVRRVISPEFFTGVMRPYFEPKCVGGKKYLSAGGAQMPIALVDLILWGAECEELQYLTYWKENLEYHPEPLRARAAAVMTKGSFLHKLRGLKEQSPGSCRGDVFFESLRGLMGIFSALEKFRYPHLRVAEENMRIRSSGSVGSGGYNIDMLEFLIRRSREASECIRQLTMKGESYG